MRAWAADQHVFVSSVMAGMTAEREAAVGAIGSIGAHPVWFEAFGGMDDDPEDAYTAQVASSDVYLGILGSRYGKPLKTGYSATHAEYNEATNRGLRISVWTTSAEQDGRQRDFLDEVRVFHTTGTYTSHDDLAERVERRLRAIAADALAPWVKVGPAVFRASSIHDDGKTLTVVARVRDDTVTASLLSRRPDADVRVPSTGLLLGPPRDRLRRGAVGDRSGRPGRIEHDRRSHRGADDGAHGRGDCHGAG